MGLLLQSVKKEVHDIIRCMTTQTMLDCRAWDTALGGGGELGLSQDKTLLKLDFRIIEIEINETALCLFV